MCQVGMKLIPMKEKKKKISSECRSTNSESQKMPVQRIGNYPFSFRKQIVQGKGFEVAA